MAFPFALAGGILGGGLGLLSKNRNKTYSTLNPEQQALSQTLGTRLSALTQGPQYYGGQMTAPYSQGEQTNLNQFNRVSPFAYDTLQSLIQQGSGDPSFEDRFTQEMVQPAYRNFRSEVAPLIEESLPSFSTERGRAIERASGALGDQLLQNRFIARESARDRALNAISGLGSFGQQGQALNAVPREIQQAGLDRQYMDYVQGNQTYAQNIGNALGFLGLSTQAQSNQPSTLSNVISGAVGGATSGYQIQQANELNDILKKYYSRTPTAYDAGGNPYSPIGGY